MDRPHSILADVELGIEPFATANMHEMIQARLTRFISNHQLSAGDKLPSQATLAQAMGISLVALREAMRALEALGIIEARVGSGWYVRDFSFDAIAKGLAYTFELNRHSFADLLEIRIRLECSYLPEAMRKLTAEDLAVLEQSVCEMERLAVSGQEFDAPDRAFHMRLFSGKVQNRLFTEVLDLFWTLYPYLPVPPERVQPEVLVADAHRHRLVLEAVQIGDAELAVQRLLDSLQGAVRRTSNLSPEAGK